MLPIHFFLRRNVSLIFIFYATTLIKILFTNLIRFEGEAVLERVVGVVLAQVNGIGDLHVVLHADMRERLGAAHAPSVKHKDDCARAKRQQEQESDQQHHEQRRPALVLLLVRLLLVVRVVGHVRFASHALKIFGTSAEKNYFFNKMHKKIV
jgi:hypothetical protein